MSNSLWAHGLKHARLPCTSLSPGVCSNSCPLSRWWHPTISSSATPFSFCFQSFPGSRSFPMSPLFESGGQSIGASASASVLLMNIQGWFSFRMVRFDLLAVQGISSVFSNTKVRKHIQPKYFLAPPHGTTMAWTSPSLWKTMPPSGSPDCKIAPSQHSLQTAGPCSEPLNAGLPAFSK